MKWPSLDNIFPVFHFKKNISSNLFIFAPEKREKQQRYLRLRLTSSMLGEDAEPLSWLQRIPHSGLHGLNWQKSSFSLLWETRAETQESGTGPPTWVLLILLIFLQSSQVRRCNMSEPSRVTPCVIYYSHLPAPREEAWSQLHLLFFTLSAVLSVYVKRIKLIQEKKVSSLGFSSPDALISPL